MDAAQIGLLCFVAFIAALYYWAQRPKKPPGEYIPPRIDPAQEYARAMREQKKAQIRAARIAELTHRKAKP